MNKNGRLVIIDNECNIEIIDLTFASEVLNILNLKLKIYNEQLGEQQATISQLKEENEQLRTQLLICQQSKSDDGRIKVWQVPPISKGMRITSFTTSDGEIDE